MEDVCKKMVAMMEIKLKEIFATNTDMMMDNKEL
jgi:hypothetical protein